MLPVAPDPTTNYDSDLDLAQRLADAADAITMQRFGAADLSVESKPDLTPVTDADRAVETAIRDVLAEHRPGDAVSGEEYGSQGTGDRRWVIDPIDGTKNFVRGVPVWATLIALLDGAPSRRRDGVRARAGAALVGCRRRRSLDEGARFGAEAHHGVRGCRPR